MNMVGCVSADTVSAPAVARDPAELGCETKQLSAREAMLIELEQLVHLCRHDPQWRIIWRTRR